MIRRVVDGRADFAVYRCGGCGCELMERGPHYRLKYQRPELDIPEPVYSVYAGRRYCKPCYKAETKR